MSNAATSAVGNIAQGTNPTQGKEGNAWHEFDILAAVVSRYQNAAPKKPQSPEHRISCHRCGNIRKRRILCTRSTCPHTFCGRCAEKMKEEHGLDVFFGGCPVCKELCCCNNKSVFCHRKNHCYRKCPATKTNGKQANITVKDDSDSEPYHEELHNIPKPENGQYGIFDLLAAVADMDKTQALSKQTKTAAGGGAPSSSSSAAGGPRKKAKTGKEGAAGGKDAYPGSMLLCEPSYSQYFSSGVPESVGNMQLLNNKALSAPDSGVDGYTFNNNTMGIIRGGLGGVTDAIALMGQQKPTKAGKFNVGMDPANFTMMSATDPLLASLAPASTSAATAGGAAAVGSAGVAGGSASASYNRLPSIDNNPFSATGAGSTATTATTAGGAPVREAAAFDQALLDSVRSIQPDPFNAALPRQLPSVPRPGTATAAPSSSSSTGTAAAAVSAPAAAPALEPMNLLALVSSITPAATAAAEGSNGHSALPSKTPSATSLHQTEAAADGGGN